MNIGNFGNSLQKLLSKLSVHPGAFNLEVYCAQVKAVREKVFPLFVPIVQLLQGLPLAFVITDKLGVDHDFIPIVKYADSSYLDFFEMIKDLNRNCFTNFMILMPTFLKEIAENEG